MDGSTAIYKGTKAALGVRAFAPADAILSVENGRIPYHIFSARTPPEKPPQPAYLDFRTARRANEIEFLTAIVPAKTSPEASELIGKMFRIAGENLTGIRVERGNDTDYVMFRTGHENALMRTSDWSADASVVAVISQDTNMRRFATQKARQVSRGAQLIFSSDVPASIAVNYLENHVDVVAKSESLTKMVLFVSNRPAGLSLDGKEMTTREFKYDATARTISFNVQAGPHTIRMVLK